MKYLYLTILLGLYFTAPAQNTSDSTEIEPTYFKLRGFSFGLTSQSAWNNDISNYDVYNPAAYELASVFTNTDTRSYPGLNFELFFEMRPSVGLNTIFNLYLGSYGQTVNSNLYSPHFYGYRFGHFQFSPTIYRNIALSNKLILQVKGGLSFNFHRFYSFVLGVPMVGSLPGGFSDSDFNKNSSSLRVLPAFGTSLLYRFNTDYLKLDMLISGVGLNRSRSQAISGIQTDFDGRRVDAIQYADNIIFSLSYVRTLNIAR